MARVSGDGSAADARASRKRPSAPRVGRRIATLIFWCAAIYVCGAGVVSITSQVFWPEETAWETSCADGIGELESELLARASENVAGGGLTANDADLRRWLRDWDLRHATLSERCDGPGKDAHVAIGKLRHRVEAMLRRFDREHAPLVREIERGVRRNRAKRL